MKREGLTRQGLGQHPVDQSGKSPSVPVVMDSVVSGGGILGRSSSVLPFDDDAFGMECSDFAHSALSSRLRTRGNISIPSRYDAFVKTTPLGPRPATLIRLFLVPLGFVGTTLCGGRIGESNLQACISSTLPNTSGCTIQRHINKELRLIEGSLYIPASSMHGKAFVFLEPTLPVNALPPSKIKSLLLEERAAEAWSSLIPILFSLPASEASSLVVVLDDTVGKINDYLFPSKPKRARLSVVKSFTKKTFLSSSDPRLSSLIRGVGTTTLSSVLLVVIAQFDDASDTLHLVGRTVVAASEGFAVGLFSFEVEVGLLQDKLGVDPGLAEIHLRTAWEGLQWIYSEIIQNSQHWRVRLGIIGVSLWLKSGP